MDVSPKRMARTICFPPPNGTATIVLAKKVEGTSLDSPKDIIHFVPSLKKSIFKFLQRRGVAEKIQPHPKRAAKDMGFVVLSDMKTVVHRRKPTAGQNHPRLSDRSRVVPLKTITPPCAGTRSPAPTTLSRAIPRTWSGFARWPSCECARRCTFFCRSRRRSLPGARTGA